MAWKEGKNLGGRPPKSHPVTTPDMARQAARNLANGMSPGQALRAAGFPPGVFKRGKAGINKSICAEFVKLGRRYIDMARDLSPEDQELLVRGKLIENVIIGTYKGVMSAKVLGSDKRISMWTPESQTGVIILKPPPMPVVKHHVPLLPPEPDDEPKTGS